MPLGSLTGGTTVNLLPDLTSITRTAQRIVSIDSRCGSIAMLNLGAIDIRSPVLQLGTVDICSPVLQLGTVEVGCPVLNLSAIDIRSPVL